jgi:hypothetical protein
MSLRPHLCQLIAAGIQVHDMRQLPQPSQTGQPVVTEVDPLQLLAVCYCMAVGQGSVG